MLSYTSEGFITLYISGDRGSVNGLCAKHINGRVTLILLLILLRVIFAVNQENSELTVASRERLWWIHF